MRRILTALVASLLIVSFTVPAEAGLRSRLKHRKHRLRHVAQKLVPGHRCHGGHCAK